MLCVTQLIGFGAADGSSFEVLAADRKTEEAATTITIPDIDFKSGGHVIFAFAWGRTSGSASVSSVSINGTAATLHIVSPAAGGIGRGTLVASASGVAGGTGSITVTYSGSATYNGIYGVYRSNAATLQATDFTDATATSVSDSVNVAAGGVIVSAHFANATSDAAIYNAGVDEDFKGEVNTGSARTGMVGSRYYPSAATPATVSTGVAGSVARLHAVASFQ